MQDTHPNLYCLCDYLERWFSDRFHQRMTEGYAIVFWNKLRVSSFDPKGDISILMDNEDVMAILKGKPKLTKVVHAVLRNATSTQLERMVATIQNPLLVMRDSFTKFFKPISKRKEFTLRTEDLTDVDMDRLEALILKSDAIMSMIQYKYS
jgi:hypothetical protein